MEEDGWCGGVWRLSPPKGVLSRQNMFPPNPPQEVSSCCWWFKCEDEGDGGNGNASCWTFTATHREEQKMMIRVVEIPSRWFRWKRTSQQKGLSPSFSLSHLHLLGTFIDSHNKILWYRGWQWGRYHSISILHSRTLGRIYSSVCQSRPTTFFWTTRMLGFIIIF